MIMTGASLSRGSESTHVHTCMSRTIQDVVTKLGGGSITMLLLWGERHEAGCEIVHVIPPCNLMPVQLNLCLICFCVLVYPFLPQHLLCLLAEMGYLEKSYKSHC